MGAREFLERQIELVLPAVGRELPQLDGMDGPRTEVPMQDRGLLHNESKRELSAMSPTIIGLDLAKNVFRSMAWMPTAKRYCTSRFGGPSWPRSLRRSRRA